MEGWCKGFNSAVDHCKHHVIYTPTIEPQQWIPARVRLPEEYGEYLVTKERANGSRTIAIMLRTKVCHWRSKNSRITAWMKAPEPWEGDTNEAD